MKSRDSQLIDDQETQELGNPLDENYNHYEARRRQEEEMTLSNANPKSSMDFELKDAAEEQLQLQSNKQEFILQFISKTNGRRSQPFTSNMDDLAKTLKEMEYTEHTIQQNDYILIVALISGDSTQIPTMPLITVESFRNLKGES